MKNNRCAKCGSDLPMDAATCVACGSPIEDGAPAEAPAPAPAPPRPLPGQAAARAAALKRLFKGLFTVAIVAGAIVLLYLWFRDPYGLTVPATRPQLDTDRNAASSWLTFHEEKRLHEMEAETARAKIKISWMKQGLPFDADPEGTEKEIRILRNKIAAYQAQRAAIWDYTVTVVESKDISGLHTVLCQVRHKELKRDGEEQWKVETLEIPRSVVLVKLEGQWKVKN